MQQNQRNQTLLSQFEKSTGLTFQKDDATLSNYNHDFGRLTSGEAAAVFIPSDINSLQAFLKFANQRQLPVTIRTNGLSQSGQSLAPLGGVIVDVGKLNPQVKWESKHLFAGASATWKDVLSVGLTYDSLPPVVPYNTNLSVGGVLSVGGLGSASFKNGVIAAHVLEMDVLTASGDFIRCSASNHSDLFYACLSGVGLFGVIMQVKLATRRTFQRRIRTYVLAYTDYGAWLDDQFLLKSHCDFLEAFVSDEPCVAGEKVCLTRAALAYTTEPPTLQVLKNLGFKEVRDIQDGSLEEYLYRHDPRLDTMRQNDTWQAYHPWYECYVDRHRLLEKLNELITILDAGVGGIYHIFPVASNTPPFFMLPEDENVVTFNVLHPGIREEKLNAAVKALSIVNEQMLEMGGKRYISGWFPNDSRDYWLQHYGKKVAMWQRIKKKYDPNNIFCSQLFSREL